MLALVDEGLLEALPNRGFRVCSFTERDFAEIFELRMMLEVPGVGRAAEPGVGEHEERLRQLADVIERTAEEGDLAGNLQTDRDFHLILLEATGNRRPADSVACLRDRTRLYNLRTLAAGGDLRESAAEHRPLLEAVLRGERARAEELMRRHLSHVPGDWSSDGGTADRGLAGCRSPNVRAGRREGEVVIHECSVVDPRSRGPQEARPGGTGSPRRRDP